MDEVHGGPGRGVDNGLGIMAGVYIEAWISME